MKIITKNLLIFENQKMKVKLFYLDFFSILFMIIHFFIYLISSNLSNSGFFDGTINSNNTHSIDLNKQILFFRYLAHGPNQQANISVFVQEFNTNSSSFFPTPNKFYQLRGNKVYIHSYEGNAEYQYVIVREDLCDNFVFALSLTNYLNTTFIVRNESRQLCYIFYEPACDYRVNLDCHSNNRNTVCKIYSKFALADDNAPEICQSNSTCEETLADGFLIAIQGQPDGISVIDTSLKVLAVKGENSALKCEAYEVDYIDIDGIHSINKTINAYCQPAKESVIIAVVLVTVLLIILIGGVLIYYKCRPNRDAYESDEAARRKPFSRNYRRNSETGTREPDMYTQIGQE